QRHPPAALRTRRNDPAGAGRGLPGDAADDHRAGGGALRAVAGAGVPDRARVRGRRRGRVSLGGGMNNPDRWLAPVAGVVAVSAYAVLGALLAGYSHMLHPVALPGADGVPRALVFNLLVFVLPGLLLAAFAWRLRGRLPARAGVGARLGTTMLLLSALAFALQGMWPLDLDQPDGGTSRLHAVAWTLWWIAFLAGTALLAVSLRALGPATLGV